MSKRKNKKMIEDVFEKTASANECTGLFQRIHLDPEEVKTFHRMYNELEDEE